MQQLLIGLGLFVVGVLWLSSWWRGYREHTRQAIADDVWDLVSGDGLGVVFAAVITVVGFAMLATALAPGEVFDYSRRFPFVTPAKQIPSKP